MLTRVFWILYTVVAAGLVFMFIASIRGGRSSERGLAIVLMSLPAAFMLVLAMAAIYSHSSAPKWIGVILLSMPLIQLAVSPFYEAAGKHRLKRGLAGDDDFRNPAQRKLANAIAAGDLELVKSLIPQAGNLNRPGESGEMLLRFAVGQTIGSAAGEAQTQIVKALVDAGANPNIPTLVTSWPLELALGRPEVTAILLDAGADPNVRGADSRPLWWHALNSYPESNVRTTEMLLAHGADLTLTDPRGMNAVGFAADRGGWKQMWMLIERGADWRNQTLWGTPIEQVVLKGLDDQRGEAPVELRQVVAVMMAEPGKQ